MKKLVSILVLCALLLLSACGNSGDGNTRITLNGSSASVKGGGASVEDNQITIKATGTYIVSGTLTDGQLIVDTGDDAMNVTIVLENAVITNLSGPALHILQAKNVRLQLAEDTENTLTSGTEQPLGQVDETASGGAIFAEDDLDIEGEGTLLIRGYLNNGITCKDDLDINSGTIDVLAVNNGVRASESLEVKGGVLHVRAGNDGLKTSSAAKEGKGYITISGGDVILRTTGDGVSAETEFLMAGGSLAVTAEGDPSLVSSNAVKAKTGLTVSGGTVKLTAQDHALDSGAAVTISGGDLELTATNGKGIDAEEAVTISGGSLRIESSGDGISSPADVRVSGGSLTITSQGDGIESGESSNSVGTLEISGGSVAICAVKRSLDAKGALRLSGGEVLALSGSEKQTGPDEAEGLGWLLSRLSGEAGERVTVGEAAEDGGLLSAFAYKNVFCAGSALPIGEMVTVSNGVRSLNAAVFSGPMSD